MMSTNPGGWVEGRLLQSTAASDPEIAGKQCQMSEGEEEKQQPDQDVFLFMQLLACRYLQAYCVQFADPSSA